MTTQLASKILSIEALSQACDTHKSKGEKVVHCHGVFDLLHIGHIRHFEKAKSFGSRLVVTITPDHLVNKGPSRPAFSQDHRAEAIAALSCVDYVAINRWPNAVNTIDALKPDVYIKGADYANPDNDKTGAIQLEKNAVENHGGELILTHEMTFSSSNLINRFFPTFSAPMRGYLPHFLKRYSIEDLQGYIEGIATQKILLIGETIIDDYHYCRTMGKAGKEPILAACFERSELFAGGILAVANHTAAVSNHVGLTSFIGKEETYHSFIKSQLSNKIEATFLELEEGPTIVKRRFVESYPFQKLFEVYIMGDDEGKASDDERLCDTLSSELSDYDLVVVVDYGHGMFSRKTIDLLAAKAPFLAINTQINAGNQGFNTISKYPRADYICISENEIRMDARKKQLDLKEIVQTTSTQLKAPRVLVTRGEKGCLCYDASKGFFDVPAFGGRAVDRVGAGDAVLAITAPLAKQSVPMEALGLIGNAVGYQTVHTVGNRDSIDRTRLLKFLEHGLK